MTRKMISAFLVVILCFSMAVSVSAEAKAIDFIIDELGYLEESERQSLNQYAEAVYENTGVGLFFAYVDALSADEYDVSTIVNGITDYVVMVETEEYWYIHVGGKGEIIDTEAEDALRAVYDAENTYIGGVAEYLYALEAYFPVVETPAANVPAGQELLVYDDADLLSDSEEVALTQKLADVSNKYSAQIVVCTIGSMDGGDIDGFVDYLYDTMGFGYGENRDGVLILVCMDPREYRILSNGFAGVAIDPDDISKISDKIVGNLSDGDYAGAFNEFADECVYYLDGYVNGFPFNAGKSLGISLIIGVVIGLIVAFVLKGQLKSVHSQSRAQEYVRGGSMHVNLSNDMFLYRNVTRTQKQSSSSSGSGGTARSKGGGSF